MSVIRSDDTHLVEQRRNLNTNPRLRGSSSGWSVDGGGVLTNTPNGVQIDFAAAPGGAFFYQSAAVAAAPGAAISSSIVVTVPAGFPTVRVLLRTHAYGPGVDIGNSPEVLIAAGESATIVCPVPLPLPAGTTGVRSLLRASSPGSVPPGSRLIVKDALVSAPPGAYFDGTTPPAPPRSYTWAGTPNASPSIEWMTIPVVNITPIVVEGFEYARAARSILHPILGNPAPDVTFRPGGLRKGRMVLVMADSVSAHAAVVGLLTDRTFTLADADVPEIGMRFRVADDDVSVQLDPVTRRRWLVTVPFQEVL